MVRRRYFLFQICFLFSLLVSTGHTGEVIDIPVSNFCNSEATCGNFFPLQVVNRRIAHCEGQLGYRRTYGIDALQEELFCQGRLVPLSDFVVERGDIALTRATEKMMSLDKALREEIDTFKKESAKQLNTSLEKLPAELLQTVEFKNFAHQIRCQVLKELDEGGTKSIDLTNCK